MDSSLKRAVSQRRDTVIKRWTERMLAAYPAESGRFLREQRDPFQNPVGRSIAASVGPLLDAVIEGSVGETAAAALDAVLRVRAVQELGPADALRFLLELREVVREQVDDLLVEGREEALATLDRGVDALVLAGFEAYLRCREEVWRIRNEEIRRRSTKVMERLDLWRAIRDGGDAEAR